MIRSDWTTLRDDDGGLYEVSFHLRDDGSLIMYRHWTLKDGAEYGDALDIAPPPRALDQTERTEADARFAEDLTAAVAAEREREAQRQYLKTSPLPGAQLYGELPPEMADIVLPYVDDLSGVRAGRPASSGPGAQAG